MIYNVELMFFWNRHESKQRFLQCIEYKHLTEEIRDRSNDWQGRAKEQSMQSNKILT